MPLSAPGVLLARAEILHRHPEARFLDLAELRLSRPYLAPHFDRLTRLAEAEGADWIIYEHRGGVSISLIHAGGPRPTRRAMRAARRQGRR